MNALRQYEIYFDRLNCAKSPTLGEAPHKPVLLLAVMEMAAAGRLQNRQIALTPDLAVFFERMWHSYVRTAHKMNLAMPFYHMKAEPFWRIKVRKGFEGEFENKNKMKGLNALAQAVEYAEIDAELWHLLQNPTDRQKLHDFLVLRYFNKSEPITPNVTKQTALSAVTLSERQAANDSDGRILQTA
ncbi:restriction endonuclease [Neisseria animalis]|uniref:Restriction endonuclease n=2 Tax=Neisseria animalis TaxID=492 RepID=A0A5P3MVS1_NEIAN|nr:restriction endonuclease [Neisseria animalis]VEE08033.1 Uncharacterised protein [Neisseria animalis]